MPQTTPCVAFRGDSDQFPNLTIKKIPKLVLSRCERGLDDNSLKKGNLPEAPREEDVVLDLFDEEDK